jgi:hypothetical protein
MPGFNGSAGNKNATLAVLIRHGRRNRPGAALCAWGRGFRSPCLGKDFTHEVVSALPNAGMNVDVRLFERGDTLASASQLHVTLVN